MSLIARLLNGRIRRPSVWRVAMVWLLAGWTAAIGWAGSDPGRQVLATGWAVLMDPGETLSPAQLADADVMRRFRALEGAPSLGYVRGAAWLRMTLPPGDGAGGERLLELQFPPIDEATLYWPGAIGLLPGRTAGDMHPLAQRDFPHRNIVFRVPPGGPEAQTFYLRVRGTNTQNFSVVLWEPQRFQAEMQTEQLLWGVVLAVHLVLILSNLWFFQATRDAPYGLFALFTTLSFLSVLSLEGFAWRHVLHDMPALNDALVVASWMLAMPAAFLFVLRFIGLVGPDGRKWARALLVSLALFSVSMVLADQWLRAPWARPAFTAVHLLTVPLMTGILAVQTWHGSPAARLMLVAMLPLILAVGARLSRNLGLLPPHPLFDHGYYIGLVIYLLVLNYAVSRSHQALREAAEAAQTRALALSRQTTRELEARVAERTADIAAAMRHVEGSLALERSLRARQREFFATVSHELRTPLAVIDTSAQNLALAQPPLPEAARWRVDKILAAAQRLAALLNQQLRDEPDTGEAPSSSPRLCVVAELLREGTASARLLGEDHHLQIEAPADSETFECDPELTRLALANLVENAVKYTPAGTTVTVRACREGQRATDALLIEVADDGPGIPASERAHLFRGPRRGAAAAGIAGTGMGLTLARRMVEAQGGTLALLDGPPQGAVMCIRLPAPAHKPHPTSSMAVNS